MCDKLCVLANEHTRPRRSTALRSAAPCQSMAGDKPSLRGYPPLLTRTVRVFCLHTVPSRVTFSFGSSDFVKHGHLLLHRSICGLLQSPQFGRRWCLRGCDAAKDIRAGSSAAGSGCCGCETQTPGISCYWRHLCNLKCSCPGRRGEVENNVFAWKLVMKPLPLHPRIACYAAAT